MVRRRVKENGDTVQAVSRALEIMEAMAVEGAPLSLTNLAHKTGLKMTTAHRILSTLMKYGFSEQDPVTMRYRLGLKVFEIGNSTLYALDIRTIARPFLKELVDGLNETTNLAVMDKGEVVYIDQLESTNIVIVRMFARVGSRGPAYCTGTGKVLLAGLTDLELLPLLEKIPLRRFTDYTLTDLDQLLAELAKVRSQGYALDRGERDEGVCCVAAPIKNYEQRTVAAISISGPAARMDESRIAEHIVPVVKNIAERISSRMGYIPSTNGPGV